ncbi:MAG TPA: DoxX family protein [Corynebacterium stationis]|uniref:DoxX family protein n=1 Tax=Corynebacterium stationis TaxID=1705 RepID=UPI001D7D9A00|nr:DoxX family protein [Corynebacterium stationis]HJG65113.1 DoxX family protein [Corynebacterium stationis]
MSTNTPSHDQPDKASDFDDELGVPAYKPSTDSTPASASPASASPASAAGTAAESTSPSDQPTTSFERPSDAEIKASEQRKASDKKPSGVRIVESIDPVASTPSSPSAASAPAAATSEATPVETSGQTQVDAPQTAEPTKGTAAPKASASTGTADSGSTGSASGGIAAAAAGVAGAGFAAAHASGAKDAEPEAVKPEATQGVPRSSVFERPGRAQPQEITPNNTQAPQSAVESQPTETINMGPTTGSQNNPYDDRDFASRDTSFDQSPTSINTSADYGNEPTTVQPAAVPAGGAAAGAGAAGYAATQQHFDSPSQYSDDTALALDADTAAAAQAEEERALRRQYGKRGTIDFGLLFVRIALGGFLIVEGVRTLFSIGESAGISGLESEYASYSMANILAMGIPVGQLVAGVFLVLGLLTPFASMLALVVTGFMAIHELAVSGAGLDVFSWPESLWLALVLFVVNIGVQFTGPGFISVDSALGVKALSSPARRPLASSWVFFILGAAALVAVWWFGAGINPLN